MRRMDIDGNVYMAYFDFSTQQHFTWDGSSTISISDGPGEPVKEVFEIDGSYDGSHTNTTVPAWAEWFQTQCTKHIKRQAEKRMSDLQEQASNNIS